MKGTITIYAETIDERSTNVGLDMNITNVSLADKFLLLDSLADGLGLTASDKKLYALFCATGGTGRQIERRDVALDSEEAHATRERFAQMKGGAEA